jgi:hypothetical protein
VDSPLAPPPTPRRLPAAAAGTATTASAFMAAKHRLGSFVDHNKASRCQSECQSDPLDWAKIRNSAAAGKNKAKATADGGSNVNDRRNESIPLNRTMTQYKYTHTHTHTNNQEGIDDILGGRSPVVTKRMIFPGEQKRNGHVLRSPARR